MGVVSRCEAGSAVPRPRTSTQNSANSLVLAVPLQGLERRPCGGGGAIPRPLVVGGEAAAALLLRVADLDPVMAQDRDHCLPDLRVQVVNQAGAEEGDPVPAGGAGGG